MKSLLQITCLVLQDCGTRCGANPLRDIERVTFRTKEEGDSFLTITLPTFCSSFEEGLAKGFILPSQFPGFRFRKHQCLPRFLGGFMEMVFSPMGVLHEHPSTDAILCIRQICLLHKRVLRPCTLQRQKKAEVNYVHVEREIRNNHVPYNLSRIFNYVSAVIWGDLVTGIPFGDPYDKYRPRHGPGTTCEGTRSNRKYDFIEWPSRVEKVFPFSEFGVASLRNDTALARISGVTYLSPRNERPVKVVFVPKTLKTPRVIAIEPVCMQFLQQGIANWLRETIEKRSSFTKGRVNFSRQDVNSQLARSSSIDGSSATIDMSEASDRVSSILVRDMLKSVPMLMRQVFACRSTRAKLPSGIVIPLRKFASMGSALCFPIEAMAFYIAIVSSRLSREHKRLTPSRIRTMCDGVYVYGDDLIVPTHEAPFIAADLESFGFKINTAKSFWTGKFRESCGKDYYDGVDVTPVYFRRDILRDKADVHGIVSTVSFANQCYFAGLWGTCRAIRSEVEYHIGTLPSVSTRSQVLGWNSFSNADSFHSWHECYQRPKVRGLVAEPRRSPDILNDDGALLKCFLIIGSDTVDVNHLHTSVRYGNLALKRRWV